MIALVALSAQPTLALAKDRIPLPKPRPLAAPAAPNPSETEPAQDAAPQQQQPAARSAPEPEVNPDVKPPSACRLALTEQVAIAPSIADIAAPGGCGGSDLVRLEAVVLADGSRVAVSPAAILRCPMASALADWVRTDIAPLAATLGSRVALLDNFDSYECRGRNRVRGAKLSEHGRANALDLRGIKLANGRMVSLTDREVPRGVRESVLQSVCARFSTVLGPGSDGYHEDHVHLDLADRRKGVRICQWEVWEPLPAVAPLLPAERPAEAPPRQSPERIAGDGASGRGGPAALRTEPAGEPQPPQPDDGAAEAEAASPPPAPAAAPATKKRREHRRL